MTESIHQLVGAYVLDALEPDEMAVFEDHLGRCEDCRREVAELRETAAVLGASQGGADVAALQESVMAAATTTAQLAPGVARPRGVLRIGRVSGWLAAAAAIVALLMVVQVRTQQQTIASMNEHSEQVMGLLTASDAKIMPLDLPQGESSVVVSMGRDEAMVLGQDLAAPEPGMVYQTWAYGENGEPIPAGTWAPDDSGDAAAPIDADLERTRAVSITVEPAGGSPQPTSPPITMLRLT